MRVEDLSGQAIIFVDGGDINRKNALRYFSTEQQIDRSRHIRTVFLHSTGGPVRDLFHSYRQIGEDHNIRIREESCVIRQALAQQDDHFPVFMNSPDQFPDE